MGKSTDLCLASSSCNHSQLAPLFVAKLLSEQLLSLLLFSLPRTQPHLHSDISDP